MKLNLNKVLYNLDGTPYQEAGKDIFMNEALAYNLVNGSKGDPMKFYDWGRELFKTGVLDLDRADFTLLKEFVKSLENVSILYKAQVLEQFILIPD